MLSMCKPIFGRGQYVVLDSECFVYKVITDIQSKGVYEGYLIKKQCYRPNVFPGNHNDAQFKNKGVGDIDMLEKIPQQNKTLRILCMKDPNCVTNIQASWMTLDEL